MARIDLHCVDDEHPQQQQSAMVALGMSPIG